MKTLLSGLVKAILFSAFILLTTTSSAQSNEQNYSFTNAALVQDAKPYVQLDWTGSKKDITYFVIERSFDGKTFKQAALEFTGEDPAFSDYKFRDRNLKTETGVIYYRIGLVNAANDVTYLPSKKIVMDQSKTTFPE